MVSESLNFGDASIYPSSVESRLKGKVGFPFTQRVKHYSLLIYSETLIPQKSTRDA